MYYFYLNHYPIGSTPSKKFLKLSTSVHWGTCAILWLHAYTHLLSLYRGIYRLSHWTVRTHRDNHLIPFCDWVVFHCVCVCVCVYVCVYTHHIFFIHSSLDGHLGCFHVLAVANSAAMNNGVCISFWTVQFAEMWPDLKIHTEWSKKEKNKYHILMHICGI